MAFSEYEAFAVSTSIPGPRCEFCFDRAAVLDGRWCCPSHRQAGLAELRITPAEIAERAAEIRATWTPAILAERWQGPRREEWNVATVADAELAAAVEDSR